MNIVIPMAGAGSRMHSDTPKFMLNARGRPMLEQVIQSIDMPGQYHFITRKEHYDKQWLDNIKPAIHITVDRMTNGPVETVLLATDYINNEEPLLIVDCDNFFNWDGQAVLDSWTDYDGGLLCHKSFDSKYCYMDVDESRITRVIEKQVISEYAGAGVYYWQHGSTFVDFGRPLLERACAEDRELYMSQVYNTAIENGKVIGMAVASNFDCLGTKQDLEIFNA